MNLVFTLVLAAVAPAAPAPPSSSATYALMGAHGEAFTQVLAEVDKAARRALTDNGLNVVAQDALNSQLDELAKSNALDGCVVTDDDCAIRIGLALGVDVVVTESVRVVGSRLLLEVSALSTSGGGARHVLGELTLPSRDDGRSVKATVLRALQVPSTAVPALVPVAVDLQPVSAAATALVVEGGRASGIEEGRLWIIPGNHDVVVKAPGFVPLEQHVVIPDDRLSSVTFRLVAIGANGGANDANASAQSSSSSSSSSSLSSSPPGSSPNGVSLPLVVALGGAGVAVAGGAVAGVCEALLYTPQSPDDRAGTHVAGIAGLVAGGVGAAAALGAGAMVMLE